MGTAACGGPCDQISSDEDEVSITQQMYSNATDAEEAYIDLQLLNDAKYKLSEDQDACRSEGGTPQ
jgi:hypothetical protein